MQIFAIRIVLNRWVCGALLAALVPLASHAQAPVITNTIAFTENRNATSVFSAGHTFILGSTGVTPAGLAGTTATATHVPGGSGPDYALGYVPAPAFPNQYVVRDAYTGQTGQWDITVTNPDGTATRRTHALDDVRQMQLLTGVGITGGSLLAPIVSWNGVDTVLFPSFCGGVGPGACALGTDLYRYQVEVRQITGTPGNATPIVYVSGDISTGAIGPLPTGTSALVPDGFLTEGNQYLIGVRFSHTEIEGFNPNGSGIAALENRSVYYLEYSTMAPVPEPETYAMMLAGLGLLGIASRRRARKAARPV